MKPKVSVIIPVYNVDRYLRECLDSVVNQTLKDIEIICVNDGSTDGSLGILQEYASQDDRIAVISKSNAGYGAAMNDGIDCATGEYVGIVEPDDYILPNMYKTLYEIANREQLDLVKSDHYEFSGCGENIDRKYVKLTSVDSYYGRVIDPKRDPLVFNLNMVTCTGIYSLRFIKENGIRYNETPGASYQDNGFWHQTFYFADRVYFTDEAFYCYRKDNAASSTISSGKVYAGKEEYEYIYSILAEHEDLKAVFMGIHTYRKFNNYLYNYRRVGEEYKKEFLGVFSRDFRDFKKRNEIDWSLFSETEARDLRQIMREPLSYYARDYGIPVVFGVDAEYFPYAIVAIETIARHADPKALYSIYILHTGLSKNELNVARGLSKANVSVSDINVSALIEKKKVYSTAHFSDAMYLRLLAPSVLSGKRKLLYLDSDLVVGDDVAKLFSVDLGENILGAVRNVCTVSRSEYVECQLGIDPFSYFNSGVLLINVEAFKEAEVEKKCFDLIASREALECPDQDALNIVCNGRVSWLDPRWNIAWQLFIYAGQTFSCPEQYYCQLDNLSEFGILHFTTGSKPWNKPDLFLSNVFWREARRSVAYERILMTCMAHQSRRVVSDCVSLSRSAGGSRGKGGVPQKGSLAKRIVRYYKKHGARQTILRAVKGSGRTK